MTGSISLGSGLVDLLGGTPSRLCKAIISWTARGACQTEFEESGEQPAGLTERWDHIRAREPEFPKSDIIGRIRRRCNGKW